MDYYQLLGAPRDATHDEIKKLFRQKAKELHPDKFRSAKGKLEAHEKFVHVLEAYKTLIDVDKRREYDSRVAPPRPKYYGYENANKKEDESFGAEIYRMVWAETPWKFVLNSFWSVLAIITVAGPFGFLFVMIWAEQFGYASNVLGKDAGIFQAIVFSYFTGAMAFGVLYAGYVRIRRIISFLQSRNEIMIPFSHGRNTWQKTP